MTDRFGNDSNPAERNRELEDVEEHECDVRSNPNLGLVESVDIEGEVICQAEAPNDSFEARTEEEHDEAEIKRDDKPDFD